MRLSKSVKEIDSNKIKTGLMMKLFKTSKSNIRNQQDYQPNFLDDEQPENKFE